ncbi:MAG TPA: hypothetical protein VF796_12575 [Humisphaera sp.]
MIKERCAKESVRDHAAKQAAERSNPYRMSMSAAPVADSSKQDWRKYSECRLRQFATGR